jgi:hypothetical protein
LPLSRIELRILDPIPRFSAPIVVYDDGEGFESAVQRISTLGFWTCPYAKAVRYLTSSSIADAASLNTTDIRYGRHISQQSYAEFGKTSNKVASFGSSHRQRRWYTDLRHR